MDNECDRCGTDAELYHDEDSGLSLCDGCLNPDRPIVLDTPEQIAMWVLLSRRAQVKIHMRGYPVKGLMTWIRENIEGAENIRTVRDGIVPLEYAIASANGPQDFTFVNLHVMERTKNPAIYQDMGIYSSPDDIGEGSYLGQAYKDGRLEIVYTLDEPRPATGDLFTSA